MKKNLGQGIGMVGSALMMAVFAACGSNTPGKVTTSTLSGSEYVVLDKGDLTQTENSISGSGKLVFKAPRPEGDSRYTLAFTLQDGGSLSLVGNANDKLEKGVTLTFTREGNALKVRLQTPTEDYDISEDYPATVDASQPFSFPAELHAHGHAIVFIAGERVESAFTNRPVSFLWGLVLNKASVTKAVASKALEG